MFKYSRGISSLLEVVIGLCRARTSIRTEGTIVTTLARLGFDSDNPYGIIEVRGVLFCTSDDAYSAAILAAEASPDFAGAHVIRHLGEFVGQSSHFNFWGDEGLEVTIVDCRRWSKLHFGYDLSLILGYMVGGLSSEAAWREATDEMTVFVKKLTAIPARDWQDFVVVAHATRADKRANLFFGLGQGNLDRI